MAVAMASEIAPNCAPPIMETENYRNGNRKLLLRLSAIDFGLIARHFFRTQVKDCNVVSSVRARPWVLKHRFKGSERANAADQAGWCVMAFFFLGPFHFRLCRRPKK